MSGMSQSARPARPQYQRSVSGLVIAMVVALVVAIGWYYLARGDQDAHPVDTISTSEWGNWVKAGRADGKLVTLAPGALPKGWRATSASYDSGVSPHWHLGMLTSSDNFVGLEESLDTTDALVREYVDDNATKGKDVTIGGATWQTYTDAGGDYAVVRTITAPGGGQERVMVVGSAKKSEIRDFAGSLSAPTLAGG